jgi:hypothetical protein
MVSAVFVFLSLSGCAGLSGVDTHVPGINAVAETQKVDVVLIHGMGTASGLAWAVDANAKLASALDRKFDEATFSRQEPTRFNDRTLLYSGVLTRSDKRAVHTHAIVWSPAVTPWKRTLCYDASETIKGVCEERMAHGRAILNSHLKSDLLDARLSDVIFYLARGETIVAGVVDALNQVLQGAPPHAASPVGPLALARMAERDVPVYFLSESLGSKILLDSLLVIFKKPPLPGAATTSDTRAATSRFKAFFMAANQVAILSPRVVGEEPCATTDNAPNRVSADCRLRQFAELFQSTASKMPTLVAFSDPNDLLSWKLEPYFQQVCRIDTRFCDIPVIDIEVRNAIAWFGVVENPNTAHTAYWGQRRVQNVLDHGKTTSR